MLLPPRTQCVWSRQMRPHNAQLTQSPQVEIVESQKHDLRASLTNSSSAVHALVQCPALCRRLCSGTKAQHNAARMRPNAKRVLVHVHGEMFALLAYRHEPY